MTDSPSHFVPAPGLSNAHFQSLLASSPLRTAAARRRYPNLSRHAKPQLITVEDGVRLTGSYSPAVTPRGLVIMLHGWEGSIESSYMLSVGGVLHDQDWSVFRLNFRDHGDSHHLNADLFHSCRIDEVVSAVVQIAALAGPDQPVALVGFSLGGNFALRVAVRAAELGLKLSHVLAVCPPLKPANVLSLLENSLWIYQAYFMRKWTESLRRKADLFPQHYPDRKWFKEKRMRTLTSRLVERYTDFGEIDNYLNGYSLTESDLQGLTVPTTIVAAEDDPVIPIADFRSLRLAEPVNLIVHRHGGHCGFIEDWSLRSWTESFIPWRLNRSTHDA